MSHYTPILVALLACCGAIRVCAEDTSRDEVTIPPQPPILASAESTEEKTPDDKSQAVPGVDGRVSDVILLLDVTRSMGYSWGAHSHLAVCQWAAFDIIDAVPDDIATAVVSLYDDASELRPLVPFKNDERSQLRRAVMKFRPQGEGKLKQLFDKAEVLLKNRKHAGRPVIVVVTDGQDCEPHGAETIAQHLHEQYDAQVQVIGICTDAAIITKLRTLAEIAKGDFGAVKDSGELSPVLAKIRAEFDAVRLDRIRAHQHCLHQLKHCRQGLQNALAEVADLELRLEKCREELADCRAHGEKLAEELKCCKENLAEAKAKIASLEKRIHELEDHLKKCHAANAELQHKLKCCEQQLCEANERIQELEAELSESQQENVRLREQLKASKNDLVQANALITDLKGQLDQCQKEKEDLRQQLQTANSSLAAAQKDIQQLQSQLSRAEEAVRWLGLWLIAALAAFVLALIALICCCARGAQLAPLRQQLSEFQRENIQLNERLRCCEAAKAAADAAVLGATREMAANKKDCCCCPTASPAVVYGPITTPNNPTSTTPFHAGTTPFHGGNTPNNGNPDNANPNNSNPNNANPDNANPNNANPNNGNPNNANPNNGNPDNANPNNSNPNNANPNNGNPNNANPNNANPNNANPNNGNNNPIAETSSSANG